VSDTSRKSAGLLNKEPLYPAIGGLAPNSICRWSPFGALHRAQDSILAGARRVVVDWSIGGADAFAQPDGTDDPGDPTPVGAQVYPIADWRRVGAYRVNVSPGCGLVARVLYAPSGIVQKQSGANWIPDGVWAAVRIGHAWYESPSGSSTAMAYRSINLEGSGLGEWGGGEPEQGGHWWNLVRTKDITGIHPAQYLQDPDVAVEYSEHASVELHVEVKGGARILQIVVYEVPLAHVQAHDNASLKSAHAAPASLAPFTPMPMLKGSDGATYDENRHGITQVMQVAERQSERLGPHIFSLSSWRESDASIWDQAEQNPFTTSSASFVDIMGSGTTTWSNESRGWIVAGSNAKLHRLCDPRLIMRNGAAAVVPVRVRVDASQSAGTGTLRVQSSAYEWVDVSITGARAWYTMVGYLASQVYGDQHIANLQVFVRCTAGTLSVYNVTCCFGQWDAAI
jgi:hypothetical protein